MDGNCVDTLVREVERRLGIRDTNIKTLFEYVDCGKEGFAIPIPENEFLLHADLPYTYTRIRHVLRNRYAQEPGILHYAKDRLVRSIQRDKLLLSTLRSQRFPLTLLGETEEYSESAEGDLLIVRRPFLLTPLSGDGLHQMLVNSWQNRGTTYEKEVLFYQRPISREQYEQLR